MGRKASRKNQKMYRMKGCSKRTRKNYLGGSADINLAYTGHNIHTVPNPFLAYTGKGGACSSNLSPSLAMPLNSNSLINLMSNHSLRSRPSSRSHSACSIERSKTYKSHNPKLSYCDPKEVV